MTVEKFPLLICHKIVELKNNEMSNILKKKLTVIVNVWRVDFTRRSVAIICDRQVSMQM